MPDLRQPAIPQLILVCLCLLCNSHNITPGASCRRLFSPRRRPRQTDTRHPAASRLHPSLRYELFKAIVVRCCLSLALPFVSMVTGDFKLRLHARAGEVPCCSEYFKENDSSAAFIEYTPTSTGSAHALFPRKKGGTAGPLRVT